MNDVRWEGFTHEEIYARVQQGPGRAASADAETAWSTVADTIRAVDAQLTKAAEQIGGTGWHGPASENVRGGMTVMSNWALDAAGDAELTRNGISAQADAAAHVRAAMPPPRSPEPATARLAASHVGLVIGTPAVADLEEKRAGDRAVAVELMNRYTSDSSTNQRMMNYWTPPPTVVVETVGPATATGPAVAGLLAPAALIPGASGGAAGRNRSSGRSGVLPGAGVGPRGGRTGGPSGGAVPAPGTTVDPAGHGPVPPVVPGGATGGPASGGVRPVEPGPPTRTLPGGARPTAPFPDIPGLPDPAARPGLPGGPSGGRLPGEVPGRPAPVPPDGVLGAPTPRAPTEGAPGRGLLEPGAAAERLAQAGRGGGVHGAGFFPFGGMPMGSDDQEHRRPDYLVDDTDAFADDHPFTHAVLVADPDDR